MSATEALKAARAAGIQLGLDGEDLTLEAAVVPPVAVLDLLSRNKAAVMALLRTSINCWSAEEWQAFYNERAAIAEFDGGLPAREAEALAFDCCIREWLNRNPVRSLPGRCHGCGESEYAGDLLLPFGTEVTGHSLLHSRCWPSWYTSRKNAAMTALTAMGIRGHLELKER
jgi:hypothetical protein